jgi:hypothetical protein
VRVDRFRDLTVNLLRALDHPDIASVEPYEVPDVPTMPAGVKVTLRSGQLVWLRTTAVAKDGGDDYSAPETIRHPEWTIPPNLKELINHGDEGRVRQVQ